jgi:hypothetical protein
VREPCIGRALREGPFASAICVYQQELGSASFAPVTYGRDLKRQSEFCGPWRPQAMNL